MVFALGILLDPARPAYSVEAEDYYRLARVALSFKSAVLETTINAVLSIVRMKEFPRRRELSAHADAYGTIFRTLRHPAWLHARLGNAGCCSKARIHRERFSCLVLIQYSY